MQKLMQKVASMKKAAFATKLKSFMAAHRGSGLLDKTAARKTAIANIIHKHLAK